MKWAGKTAVVTGGASGLGRALSQNLGRRGARVFVVDINEAGAEATAASIREAGGEAWARVCDVRDPEAMHALARDAEATLGEVDIIVNNAGIAIGGPAEEIPLEDWQRIMDLNLWGVIHGCQAFVPAMRRRGHGAVLNVASVAGFASPADYGPYNVTKAGVIALTETLRLELGPLGIRTTALCPSFFPTGIMDADRGQLETDELRDFVQSRFDKSRWTADQVAEAGLKALSRGRLYAVPMFEGRLVWWAKRVVPESYPWLFTLARRFMGDTRKAA